jgi:hypothetical protein
LKIRQGGQPSTKAGCEMIDLLRIKLSAISDQQQKQAES